MAKSEWEEITGKSQPPRTGEAFLAWYKGDGLKFGTMAWREGGPHGLGRYHSYTMGTRSKDATHWRFPEGPDVS